MNKAWNWSCAVLNGFHRESWCRGLSLSLVCLVGDVVVGRGSDWCGLSERAPVSIRSHGGGVRTVEVGNSENLEWVVGSEGGHGR